MSCHKNVGILFPTKQGIGPSSPDEEGKIGLFLSCGGTLGVPLEWRRVCRGTSLVASRVSRTLSRLKSKVRSLSMPQQKRDSSRVEGRISWFFTSCGRKFGVPIELLWGSKGPACVASGESSLHEICEGPLRIPLQSLQGSGTSSRVQTGTSGLISSADMDLGVPLEFPQGSQASSQVKTCKSTFLSSWKSSVRLSVELT